MSWDPDQYAKFAGPRLQPGLDLINHLPTDLMAGRIVDLGCGTGSLTARLASRFAGATVTGIDHSPEMLATARAAFPGMTWQQADIAQWRAEAPVDLVYSNAALHWLDDHGALLERIVDQVAPGGVLAVQMPDSFDEPAHTLIRDIAAEAPFAGRIKPLTAPVWPAERYYDLLAGMGMAVDLWQTVYHHVLTGQRPVVEWGKATSLRPVFNALEGDELAEFIDRYADRIDQAYPRRPDGTVIYPFARLFFVAVKPA